MKKKEKQILERLESIQRTCCGVYARLQKFVENGVFKNVPETEKLVYYLKRKGTLTMYDFNIPLCLELYDKIEEVVRIKPDSDAVQSEYDDIGRALYCLNTVLEKHLSVKNEVDAVIGYEGATKNWDYEIVNFIVKVLKIYSNNIIRMEIGVDDVGREGLDIKAIFMDPYRWIDAVEISLHSIVYRYERNHRVRTVRIRTHRDKLPKDFYDFIDEYDTAAYIYMLLH